MIIIKMSVRLLLIMSALLVCLLGQQTPNVVHTTTSPSIIKHNELLLVSSRMRVNMCVGDFS